MLLIKNLTERDLEILLSLYKYRTFTTTQIHQKFFPTNANKNYVYHRLYMLREDGYLGKTEPILDANGHKKTSCYFLTDKAITTLKGKGLIDDPIKAAKDIRVDRKRLPYVIDVNQVYVELSAHGWRMKDSRMVKKEFHLNRRNLIQGLLMNPDGVEYGLYVLSTDPQETTLLRLLGELKEMNRTRVERFLILCKTREGYEDFIDKYRKNPSQFHTDIHVLPYEIGIQTMKKIGHKDGLEHLYSSYGPIEPVNTDFCSYMMTYRGERVYVTEMLTNSSLILKKLFLYNPYEYQKIRIPMVVFAWQGFISDLQESFQEYPHIRFEGVTMRFLDNLFE